MIGSNAENVKEFWKSFCAANDLPDDTEYHARTFSDSRYSLVTDEIAELARQGNKRGTCHLQLDFEKNAVPYRFPGDYMVVLNSTLTPLCVIQCRRLEFVAFNQVTDEFAASEGEGDLSYDYWAKVHKRYFVKLLETWGLDWDASINVVCESFETVWPKPYLAI